MNQHVELITSLNVRLILCMFVGWPARALTRPPFQMLHLRTFDSPLLPMPLNSLRRGVEAALPEIQAGRSMLMYCKRWREWHGQRVNVCPMRDGTGLGMPVLLSFLCIFSNEPTSLFSLDNKTN